MPIVKYVLKHYRNKNYSESTKRIVKDAMKFAEEKRKQGWTRQDAVESLKKMLNGNGDEMETIVETVEIKKNVITPYNMAVLIADSLVDSSLIKPGDLKKVVETVEEEIRIRLILGNEIK